MLVEFAPSKKRDTPCLQKVRRHIVTRRTRALLHRRQIAIATRVQRSIAATQWNVPAHRRVLNARHIVQGVEDLLDEMLTRCRIGILSSWQRDRSGPEML